MLVMGFEGKVASLMATVAVTVTVTCFSLEICGTTPPSPPASQISSLIERLPISGTEVWPEDEIIRRASSAEEPEGSAERQLMVITVVKKEGTVGMWGWQNKC